MSRETIRDGALVLADGSVFEGELIGAEAPIATGEVVFNTVMTGYQEVITDPSYAGQIITFTTAHLGNYGVNPTDDESRGTFCRGIVIRELSRRHSNHRATGGLDAMLATSGVPGIAGIDTRRLTRHLRDRGALPGAFGADEDAVRAAAAAAVPTDGIDLVAEVTTSESYAVGRDDAPYRVVAYDLGIKRTILTHLVAAGCRVEVVPASLTAAEVLARDPDGVFLSNGPGDPAAVAGVPEAVRQLLGQVPVFGICLGHQIMGLALGAETGKLPFGHHGANHPVRHMESGRVEITSQNHNYIVRADTVPGGADVTRVNLNDGTVEGLKHRELPIFAVQYHPEAAPGPHDARPLFHEFMGTVRKPRV